MKAINEVVHILTQCLKFCHDSFELRLHLVLKIYYGVFSCEQQHLLITCCQRIHKLL